jgi:hypothetical protein
MPACPCASPAVVMVRIPVTKVSFSCSGSGTGPHLSWPSGSRPFMWSGADFHSGISRRA